MEAFYGPEWKDELATAGGALQGSEEEEEEEEEKEKEEHEGEGLPPITLAEAPEGGLRPAQRGQLHHPHESLFHDMSLVRLQEGFLKEYTPGSETAARFAKRLRRVSEAPALFGEEVDEALVDRRAICTLYLWTTFTTQVRNANWPC